VTSDLLREGFLNPQTESINEFTSSTKSDFYMAPAVLDINKAHVVMLVDRGILGNKDGSVLLQALDKIDPSKMDPRFEDIHMNLEQQITAIVGDEIGGKIHTGKSRNDQVATSIRIALRASVLRIMDSIIRVRETLLLRCNESVNVIMPGYTHLQRAQPVTLAHHLLAHHDAIERDWSRLLDAYRRINLSPMGAAAIATTSFPIDRIQVADLLGFDDLIENSMDAVSSRDFATESLYVLSQIMTDLSRISEELILWSTQEFGLIELPDKYVSTSSIMPQKKNPVTAELIRAKTGSVYGDFFAFLVILKALPLSYNIDLQEATPHLWSSCEATYSSLEVMNGIIKDAKFDEQRLLSNAREDLSTATDLSDALVKEFGVPFRTAHRIVRTIVKELPSRNWDMKAVSDLMLRESKGKILLTKEKLYEILNPKSSVLCRSVLGGPSPKEVKRALNQREKALKKDSDLLRRRIETLEQAAIRLKANGDRIKSQTKRPK
jgi:argininosuccinate lyase